ncbi:hypothetical protein LCGC14_3006370 [marine sediment metagenome]|uniref:Uncharacterized protein n=1 Tax=marine sediment metagenome TaxID=412755 RepID=A0A0F8WZZ8_9ZZZZ
MENVFKKKEIKSIKKSTANEVSNRPVIKDLAKEFLKDVSKYSQAQKISLMYKIFIGKKPDVGLSNDQLMNRILYTAKFGKYIKHTKDFLKKKKNKFKWPSKWKRLFKSSRKKRNQILVWFLNIKGEIEPPKLYPIYSSNMVIIKSRPYEIDPRSFWRMGKYICQIIKGIDRRPVSNLDYNEIKKRGDSTDSDEFLIKAALQAIVGVPHKKPVDKKTMIIIGVIVLAAIVFFLSQ